MKGTSARGREIDQPKQSSSSALRIGHYITPLYRDESLNTQRVRRGLLAAGVMNIFGVLVFSRGFTNMAITEADPAVMSTFGLLMIMVWGLAYIAAASIESSIKWLVGVFAIEKLFYVTAWLVWHSQNSLIKLYSRDIFAGLFFSIYGINDCAFMLFFTWVFFWQHNSRVAMAIIPK